MLFSYQNLSPFFRIWNCWPRRQPKVGPTTAPVRGFSERPPMKRSMSSTSYKVIGIISRGAWHAMALPLRTA